MAEEFTAEELIAQLPGDTSTRRRDTSASPPQPPQEDSTAPQPQTQQEAPPAKKPYRKSTKLEIKQRVEVASVLIGQSKPKHQVIAILKQQYKISTRMAQHYVARARKRLIEKTGKSEEQHFQDAQMFWMSIVEDPRTDLNTKMRAQEALEKLLGLHRPQKSHIELTGANGGPLELITFAVQADRVDDVREVELLPERNGETARNGHIEDRTDCTDEPDGEV